MRLGGMGAMMAALSLVAACGGGDPATADSGTVDGPPVLPDAAPTGACYDDLVDLDNPAIGQHTGNEVLYMGTVRGGTGELDPEPGCVTGGTLNEVAHKITTTGRVRIRAHTFGMNTPNLDSVVYIRTDCLDASSELACNDDAGAAQSLVIGPDLPSGTTVFIVVDSATSQPVALPQPYQVTVIQDPVVSLGDPCDPTTATNVCESGTVCSVATGSPVCAAPLGGPMLTALSARERENGSSMEINFMGSDPDGDVLQALTSFLDASGNVIDFSGDGVGDEYNFFVTPPLPGNLTFTGQIELLGLGAGTLAAMVSVRVRLVDSAGTASASVDAPMAHPDIVGPGAACGPADIECQGELTCTTALCTEPSASVNACATAEASTAITAPGTTMVDIAAGAPDNFAGSCFWDTGYGEEILKITIPGPQAMRLTAHTDVAPSGDDLDSYVYVRSTCGDPSTELGCNDDIGGGSAGSPLASSVSVPLNPGTYYLFIDGSSAGGGFVADGPMGVAIEMVALLDPGAACVPATDECAPGHICADATGGTAYTCTSRDVLITAECASAPVIVPGTPVAGSVTLSSASLVEGSCRFAGPYPEQYHVLTLTERSTVTASTGGSGTNFDTVVFFLDGCSSTASEIAGACNDDIDPGAPDWRSSITTTLDPGTYAIVVDMSSPNLPDGSGASPDPASYSLLVTAVPAP